MKKKKIDIKTGMGFGNIFNLKKIDKKGDVIEETGEFNNLITDYYMDTLPNHVFGHEDYLYQLFTNCHVGSDNSAPLVSDTSLGAQVAVTTNKHVNQQFSGSSDPLYGQFLREWEFIIGTFSGETIREVGISAGGNLYNRQLLPSPLTLDSDEGLRVEFKGRIYPAADFSTPSSTAAGSLDINGSPVGFIAYVIETPFTGARSSTDRLMWASRNNFIGKPKIVLSSNTGLDSDYVEGNANDSISTGSYTNGTFTLTSTATWNPGNFTGDIQSIHFCLNTAYIGIRVYSYVLDETVAVSDLEEVNLTYTMSWARK